MSSSRASTRKHANRCRLLLSAIILITLWPSRAAAHLVTTGMGPVCDGIGHLLLSPEDFLPVLAIAIYSGLRGSLTARRTIFLLPLSWLIGGMAGSTHTGVPPLLMQPISFLLVGALVAADLTMPANAVALITICLGFIHGSIDGAALANAGGTRSILGIAIMIFILVTLVSAFVVSLKRPWTRIAVRVLGSWIFAGGVLFIGWMVKAGM